MVGPEFPSNPEILLPCSLPGPCFNFGGDALEPQDSRMLSWGDLYLF